MKLKNKLLLSSFLALPFILNTSLSEAQANNTKEFKTNNKENKYETRSYYYFNNYYKKNPPKQQNNYYLNKVKLQYQGKYLFGQYKYLVISKYGYIDPNKTYVFSADNKVYQRHIYTHVGTLINIQLIN